MTETHDPGVDYVNCKCNPAPQKSGMYNVLFDAFMAGWNTRPNAGSANAAEEEFEHWLRSADERTT